MKKILGGIPLLLLGLFVAYHVSLPDISEPLAVSTYYSETWQGSASGMGLIYYRNKYVTDHIMTGVNYGKKQTLGTVTNTESKAKQMSASYAKAESRTYTLNAKVPVQVLKKAVDVTIGGSLSYTTTITLSGSITVPARSSRNFYYRTNTETATFSTTKQTQKRNLGGSSTWKNYGSAEHYTEKVITKTPELIA